MFPVVLLMAILPGLFPVVLLSVLNFLIYRSIARATRNHNNISSDTRWGKGEGVVNGGKGGRGGGGGLLH